MDSALAVVLAPSLAARAADNRKAGTADSSETKYHDGSINDLSAIGNRNVGCGRGVGNWYSIEKQIALGKGFADQINRTAKMVQDPVVTEYVNRIGQNIVRNSDAQVPFTIKVIDSDRDQRICSSRRLLLRELGLDPRRRQRIGAGRGDGARDCPRLRLPCRPRRHPRTTRESRIHPADLCRRRHRLRGSGVAGRRSAGGVSEVLARIRGSGRLPRRRVSLQERLRSAVFCAFFEKIEAMEKRKPGLLTRPSKTILPRPIASRKPKKKSNIFCRTAASICSIRRSFSQ